jgi:hypothetical protein
MTPGMLPGLWFPPQTAEPARSKQSGGRGSDMLTAAHREGERVEGEARHGDPHQQPRARMPPPPGCGGCLAPSSSDPLPSSHKSKWCAVAQGCAPKNRALASPVGVVRCVGAARHVHARDAYMARAAHRTPSHRGYGGGPRRRRQVGGLYVAHVSVAAAHTWRQADAEVVRPCDVIHFGVGPHETDVVHS